MARELAGGAAAREPVEGAAAREVVVVPRELVLEAAVRGAARLPRPVEEWSEPQGRKRLEATPPLPPWAWGEMMPDSRVRERERSREQKPPEHWQTASRPAGV
jgi:hypothetical protein